MSAMRECVSIPHGGLFFVSWPFSIVPASLLGRWEKRAWSFSGLATMIRIMLMYYVNCYTFLENPETDWAKMVQKAKETPPEPSLFD